MRRRRLVDHVRENVREWDSSCFSNEEAQKAANDAAHLYDLHKNLASRKGMVNQLLQDLRDKEGLIFVNNKGLYRWPDKKESAKQDSILTTAPVEWLVENEGQQTATQPIKEDGNMMTETALQAAFVRASTKAESAPDRTAKAAKKGFTTNNVVSVLSIQPRKTETFILPESGREIRVRYEFFRPSDFVANIASIANPGLGYQRRPQDRMAKLNSLARKFKPILLGLFHAWINEDGLPESLDGLGRTFVCLHKISPPYNTPVLTAIHLDVTNRQQAAVRFRELNPPEVTRVGIKDTFQSRLAEGDEVAVAVSAEARAGGLIAGGSGRDGISVPAAEGLHQMGILKEVGLLKTNGEWTHKLPNPYFIGLGGYLVATGDNSQIMREMMRATSVQVVVKEMHSLYDAAMPHARITASRFARALLSLRNYKRTSNRVTPDWPFVDALMSEPPFNDRWGALKGE